MPPRYFFIQEISGIGRAQSIFSLLLSPVMGRRKDSIKDVCLAWKITDSHTFCTTFVPLANNRATSVLLRLILVSKEVNSTGFMIQSIPVLHLCNTFPPLKQKYLFIQITNGSKASGCQENHPATIRTFAFRAQKKTKIGKHRLKLSFHWTDFS